MNAKPVPNTTPQDQFRDDVVPPYEAYMSDMGSQWKARAAGNAVAHFAEHVWVYYDYHDPSQLHGATSPEEYVEYMANNNHCPELKIIWDFALSGKHRFLTRKVHHRHMTTATDAVNPRIIAGSTDSIIAGSTNSGAANAGRLWMPDCNRYYDDVLEKAVNFWRGHLPTAPTYP